MNAKRVLQKIEKLLPSGWLYQVQNVHSALMFRWILRVQSQPQILSQKSAMVFSPHQDDETFGCGGMIALKRKQEIPVTVVFLTDGQGNGGLEVNSKEKIIEIRQQEAKAALKILGVEANRIHFFNQLDGSLQSLNDELKQKTIEQIIKLLEDCQPEEVYVPHRKDCHCDHEATYALVQEAIAQSSIEVELLQYPIWMFWRAPLFIILRLKDIAAPRRLSIASVQVLKEQAIASYRSQLQTLPHGFVKRFLSSYKIFFKVEL